MRNTDDGLQPCSREQPNMPFTSTQQQARSHACLSPHLCSLHHSVSHTKLSTVCQWGARPPCAHSCGLVPSWHVPPTAFSTHQVRHRPTQEVHAVPVLAPPSQAGTATQSVQPTAAHEAHKNGNLARTATSSSKQGSSKSIVAERLKRIQRKHHTAQVTHNSSTNRGSEVSLADASASSSSSSAYASGHVEAALIPPDDQHHAAPPTPSSSKMTGSTPARGSGAHSASGGTAAQLQDTSLSASTQYTSPAVRGSAGPAVNESEMVTEAAKMNPVYRLIRKTELQMARRVNTHNPAEWAISGAVPTEPDSSGGHHLVQPPAGNRSNRCSSPAVMESEMAWEGARMNPVYRMIRKTELQMKKGAAKSPTAPASPPQTGLASLFSLSESLLSVSELGWDDPGSQLADTLDPGRRSLEGLWGTAAVPLPAPGPMSVPAPPGNMRPSANAVGALRPWERAKRRTLRQEQPAPATAKRQELEGPHPAPVSDQLPLAVGMSIIPNGTGVSVTATGSTTTPNDTAVSQQSAQMAVSVDEKGLNSADVDYWPRLPRFPSTGHVGVDRTIRIRQLSLAQRKKQQAMAAAQHQQLWQQQEQQAQWELPSKQGQLQSQRKRRGSVTQAREVQQQDGSRTMQKEQQQQQQQQVQLQVEQGHQWQQQGHGGQSMQERQQHAGQSWSQVQRQAEEKLGRQDRELCSGARQPTKQHPADSISSTTLSSGLMPGSVDLLGSSTYSPVAPKKRGRPRKSLVVHKPTVSEHVVVAHADGHHITLPAPRKRSRPSHAVAGLSSGLSQTATLAIGRASPQYNSSSSPAVEEAAERSTSKSASRSSGDLHTTDKPVDTSQASASVVEERRRRWLPAGSTAMATAAAKLSELLSLDKQAWPVETEAAADAEVLAVRAAASARVLNMLQQQPSLAARTPESLAGNLTALARILGVPKTRVVDAVVRYPALLELAPVTVWLRHRHLMQLADRHHAGRVRPLDVAEAVCQCPALLGLSSRTLLAKVHALAAFHSAFLQTAGSASNDQGISGALPSQVPAVAPSSQPAGFKTAEAPGSIVQPKHSNAGPSAQKAESIHSSRAGTKHGEPDSAAISWALDMLLQFPGLARCSAALLATKCEQLGTALQLHPRWLTDARHMTPAYLARCLSVSDKVLSRLPYVAHLVSVGDQAAVSKYAMVADGARDVTALGYLLLLSQTRFDARFPGFHEWSAARG